MSTEVLTKEQSAELVKTAILAVDRGKLLKTKATWEENLALLTAKLAEEGPLASVEQEQWAADQMTAARVLFNDLEADRKREVRPLIDEKDSIDGDYKLTTKPILAFIALIKSKLDEAHAARKRAEEALQLQAATLAAAGDDEGCQAALAVLPAQVKIAGASTTEKWTFKLLDISKVPPEYLALNEAGLKALCKTHDALNTKPTVPGLAFVREAQTRATSRSSKK